MNNRNFPLFKSLEEFVSKAMRGFESLPPHRKQLLKGITDFAQDQQNSEKPIKFIFICTHNSRRSHFSQIWAQVASFYYGIKNVECYSGGTEATAFNPRAVEAARRSGLEISSTNDLTNPIYTIGFAPQQELEVYSKRFDDPENPKDNFCAVMTCTHADENCPIIVGASKRISLPYEDPKAFDGTEYEAIKYDERCLQIATEIFYAFSNIQRI